MSSIIYLPEKFKQTVRGVHKEKGEAWLQCFEEIIGDVESRWSLKINEILPLSYNFVASAIRDNGSEVVIKLSVPNKEFVTEKEALQIYAGQGMCQLLDADMERGVLILEKINPGKTLMEYFQQQLALAKTEKQKIEIDDQVTKIACRVMKKLRRPAPNNHIFPTTEKWAKGLERLRKHYHGGTGIFPREMVEEVEQLFPYLHNTMSEPFLLHGDLHHGNILSAEKEDWIAIDPKGVIGEEEYGIIQFLLNELPNQDQVVLDIDLSVSARETASEEPIPIDGSNNQVEQILKRRVDIFAQELNLDKKRIISWGYCHSVLSAWWCVEDQVEGAEETIKIAQIFKKLLIENQVYTEKFLNKEGS